MYMSLGTAIFEFLWLAGSRRRSELKNVFCIEASSRERFEAARAKGRGVVLAASHTGNWDLVACALAASGVPLRIITKHLACPGLDRFWQSTRRAHGVRLTPARGAMSIALSSLRGGETVVSMIDQVPEGGSRAVTAPFLGAEAWIDCAPFVFAARAGAPLLVVAARRERGKHVAEVLTVLEPPLRPNASWVDEASRQATTALETFVRAHPGAWLWMHRRWKKPKTQHAQRRSTK